MLRGELLIVIYLILCFENCHCSLIGGSTHCTTAIDELGSEDNICIVEHTLHMHVRLRERERMRGAKYKKQKALS
jgi:hypothetical protein